MSTYTTAERIAFIEKLDIEPPPPALVGAAQGTHDATSDAEAAYVDDGSVEAFVSHVSGQARQDVLNSTLLAQLAANKMYDRFSDTWNWYRYYIEVLGSIGWSIQGFKFDTLAIRDATFTVDQELIRFLQKVLTPPQVSLVQAALTALELARKKDRNDSRFAIFDTHSHSSSSANFQVSLVTETNGVVAMTLSVMLLETSELVTTVFWTTFSTSKSKLKAAAQSVTLNPEIYGAVRATVAQKLGASAQAYVGKLDI